MNEETKTKEKRVCHSCGFPLKGPVPFGSRICLCSESLGPAPLPTSEEMGGVDVELDTPKLTLSEGWEMLYSGRVEDGEYWLTNDGCRVMRNNSGRPIKVVDFPAGGSERLVLRRVTWADQFERSVEEQRENFPRGTSVSNEASANMLDWVLKEFRRLRKQGGEK